MDRAMTNEELDAHIEKIAKEFKGYCPDLMNAIGALHFGRLYGYKVLRICISSQSYTKHQRTLGLNFRDVIPAETQLSSKSVGYSLAKDLDNYWNVIKGVSSIEPRKKAEIA